MMWEKHTSKGGVRTVSLAHFVYQPADFSLAGFPTDACPETDAVVFWPVPKISFLRSPDAFPSVISPTVTDDPSDLPTVNGCHLCWFALSWCYDSYDLTLDWLPLCLLPYVVCFYAFIPLCHRMLTFSDPTFCIHYFHFSSSNVLISRHSPTTFSSSRPS